METGIIVLVIALGIACMSLSAYIIITRKKPKSAKGILNVDYSDPEDGPYLFLELMVPIEDVVSKRQILLDVNITKYVSQK